MVIGQPKQPLATSAVPVHDPVMIKEKDTWYLFATGMGISVWSSKDKQLWTAEKPVFSEPPTWAIENIKGYRGHTWAPDISYHNGLYHLYYSVSAFGKNTSAIGLAVNKTLDPASKDFKWMDRGKVIQSVPGRDMWNAIDPNLVRDDKNQAWLSFGSFWNGIKLVRLNDDQTAPAQPEQWFTLASRPRSFYLPDSVAGDAAIEAPFIFKKDGYYYLFVSFDYCCRGERSTYKVVAGRSEKLEGPYLDWEGVAMTLGGGTTVFEGSRDWHGVGHNAVITDGDKNLLVCHGYDAKDKGRSKLIIRELKWRNGWPFVTPMPE
ncbi:ABC transporter substrate-binding protein [Flavihumibacter stibioxidans]|uniref:ABC transporter substrate-binding protein n=2 Tax=Flavihumibacter stibioxidans TaxID=1834163 RepID=A0ABR7MAC3_9BACT|nr:ABC transporter substrate-binding protein [Flavihumibacter stibioxidans]